MNDKDFYNVYLVLFINFLWQMKVWKMPPHDLKIKLLCRVAEKERAPLSRPATPSGNGYTWNIVPHFMT